MQFCVLELFIFLYLYWHISSIDTHFYVVPLKFSWPYTCFSTFWIHNKHVKKLITRRHSSRICTVRCSDHCGGVLTRGCTCPGGVPAWGVYLLGGCTCPRERGRGKEGVPAWGVYLHRGCTCWRGMYLLGVYLPGGGLPARGYLPRGCTCPGGVPDQGCTCLGV